MNDVLTAPFSQEAEESVIGSVMISPHVIDGLFFLHADDFFLVRHRVLWDVLMHLRSKHEVIDLTTISARLGELKELEGVGGYAYLVQLVGSAPNAEHAEAYARIVERTSTRRKLLKAADEIRHHAINESIAIEDVNRKSEKAVLDVTSRHIKRRGGWIGDLIETHYDNFVQRLQAPDDAPSTDILTGFQDVDALINGFEDQRLYVLAGRPGMGKTAWVLSAFLNMARAGVPVLMHTMEMSTEQLLNRLLAIQSGVSTTKLADPKQRMSVSEQRAAVAAFGVLAELPIYIEDSPSPTPRDVMAKSEWYVRSNDVRMIFVDGIYRMSPDYDTKGDETRATSQIAKGLKDIARELMIPVLATHQLNRDVESRNDKRPMLSDLRQSGRIEEEADVVMFLYRACMYDQTADPSLADLIVAKNRDGDTKTVKQGFDRTITHFYDVDIVHVSLTHND